MAIGHGSGLVSPARLRLGHIVYSNCFPVHSRLFDLPQGGDPVLVAGIPSHLNRLLRQGDIDVSPSSSIEYALNSERYRILPDLVIGAKGPVRSIVFLSRRPPEDLDGAVVAVPTASATSVVLLKILLAIRWKVKVEFRWFDQESQNPLSSEAAAALFIGDVALRAGEESGEAYRFDLGKEWWDETGLPFAFAVWQAASGAGASLRDLHRRLLDSREYGAANRERLAQRYGGHFGIPPEELSRYWNDLTFTLDEPMRQGLEAFYRFAAEIGELPRAPELRWLV